jgi:hypothetical protein
MHPVAPSSFALDQVIPPLMEINTRHGFPG